MRLWRTTKHENSQTGRKPFIFNTHSGYFHSSVNQALAGEYMIFNQSTGNKIVVKDGLPEPGVAS
jgi:hypothetical protein